MLIPKDIDFNSQQISYAELTAKFDLRFEIPDEFTPDFHLLERIMIGIDTWNRGEINLYGFEETRNKDEYVLDILNVQGINKFLTLFRFIELEEFKIQDFVILTEFNGLSFSEIDRIFQRRLRECSLNIYYMYKGLIDQKDIPYVEKLLS